MSIPPTERNVHLKLRTHAEAHLKAGSAPPTKGWPTGTNALNLLYTLASSAESADAALKLLHELQVHQVELDLQHEQLENTRRELLEDLARYKGLYESAPVGYFNVSFEGCILEGNVAGAELFGSGLDKLRGLRIESLLAPASRPVLVELLRRLQAGDSKNSREVQSGRANGSRPLRVVASIAPGGASFLMVFLNTVDPNVS